MSHRSRIEERIDSTAESVRNALKRTTRALAERGACPREIESTEVVLAELMNNVVEHAYLGQPGRSICLRVDILDDSLSCHVVDDGLALPGLAPPPVHRHDFNVDLEDLPEGGFGWTLIQDLTCELGYVRSNGQNHVSFCICRNRTA
ncbi:serine/threonine-protein kinase RsbW [Aliiruegeria haliotis]|uniref:Serine/threonine-protein kinase RsbW n=1 Tax=Aliiruegeria haliotis TaxID=1280846 RepID=A0A2T0RI70_9RHOB|nr:ATP-binding protein [Aliiruegeria haliotis]PRY20906.1 serine/threonine-protein kinase RsbW [Aliiruegeria haliotis]